MNKPDKPGEPSIDEILASIRQKTAAEGAQAPGPFDSGTSEPPAAHSAEPGTPPPRENPPALLDRLNGMGKSAPPGGSSFGSKRPLPFDQDLADMFDEPGPTGPGASAPKPEMRVTPSLGAFPAKSGGEGARALNGSSIAGPGEASPPGSASPQGTAPAEAPRAPAFGFPPLTKQGGFYPAQRTEPRLPPMPNDVTGGADAKGPDAGSGGAPTPSQSGSSQPFSDFGALVPGEAAGRGAHSAPSSFGAPPLSADGTTATGGGAPVGHVLPNLEPAPSQSPSFGTMAAATSQPAQASTPGVPSAGSLSASPTGPSAGTSPEFRLKDAAPAASDFASAASGVTPPRETSGTQALDALAAGLTASGMKSDAPPAALTPVPEPRPAPAAAQASPGDYAAVTPVPAETLRSLEDVVADMLRPMLQKWVAENMPRIMEKALRSEMQRTMGSGKSRGPNSGS